MSERQPETFDLNGEYIEHIHLLSSFELGWQNINLIYELEPAGEMPETPLEQHMLIVCLGDFRANYWLDGKWKKQAYQSGDLIIIPAEQSLPKTQIDRQVPLLELFLDRRFIDRVVFEDIHLQKMEIIPHFKLRDPLIEAMGLSLKTELEYESKVSQLYTESIATALSVHLLKKYGSETKEIKPYSGGLSQSKLRTIVEYINDNLDRELSLIELAEKLRMSPYYFCNLFKRSMGVTPHQYIIKCRLKKAKYLLRYSQLSLIEICHEVGFPNQSYFTRIFRKHAQTTPKVYRDSF